MVVTANVLRRSKVTMKTDNDELLLTPKQAAELLGVSLSWLAKSRLRGDGIPYTKLGRSIRYTLGAIRTFLKLNTRLSTSDYPR